MSERKPLSERVTNDKRVKAGEFYYLLTEPERTEIAALEAGLEKRDTYIEQQNTKADLTWCKVLLNDVISALGIGKRSQWPDNRKADEIRSNLRDLKSRKPVSVEGFDVHAAISDVVAYRDMIDIDDVELRREWYKRNDLLREFLVSLDTPPEPEEG